MYSDEGREGIIEFLKYTDEDELEEGEEEVECILDHNEEEDGEFSYLLKWLNAGDQHNSWHHQGDLAGCDEIIAKYWQDAKAAESKLNGMAAFITDTMGNSITQQCEYMSGFIGMISNKIDQEMIENESCIQCVSIMNATSSSMQALTDWQIQTLLGDDMCYTVQQNSIAAPVTEIPPKDFILMEGGHKNQVIRIQEVKNTDFYLSSVGDARNFVATGSLFFR